MDKPRSEFAPQGRAGNGVPASQPVATRPLAIQNNGTWYTYGLDLTKNVCVVFGSTGYIATVYTYTPFGEVTATGNVDQPIQWSSEYHDGELGMLYYNYRYYNYIIGRWLQRDKMEYLNLYNYGLLMPINAFDYVGNNVVFFIGGINENPYAFADKHDSHIMNFKITAMVKAYSRACAILSEDMEFIEEGQSYAIREYNITKHRIHRDAILQSIQNVYNLMFEYTINKSKNVIYKRSAVNSSEDLRERLATNPRGGKRKGKEKISIFYYYGHGAIGKLCPRYEFSKKQISEPWYIRTHDIGHVFRREYFQDDALIFLTTCHSASTNRKSTLKRLFREINEHSLIEGSVQVTQDTYPESFAQVLSEHLMCKVVGYDGRVDYAPTANRTCKIFPRPEMPTLGTSINIEADTKAIEKFKTIEKTYSHGFLRKEQNINITL